MFHYNWAMDSILSRSQITKNFWEDIFYEKVFWGKRTTYKALPAIQESTRLEYESSYWTSPYLLRFKKLQADLLCKIINSFNAFQKQKENKFTQEWWPPNEETSKPWSPP